ncbi:MAG TPA: sulfatase-like hydrolase/transferase [Terriglobia bacterium]|nr:sulfatase-like hydrolase/transferase [Terriglobia bacterium]
MRGRTLAIAVAAALLLCLGGCRRQEPEQAPAAPRDASVLLITLDTTRADHLSCYNPHGARTPHLDSLAARGVLFRHATAQVPLTLPSHACIMTGAYPTVHKLRDMGGFVLDKSHPTIASLTQAAGFSTAAFVGSRVVAKHFGLSHGFDTYDDDMGGETEEGKLPGVFPERRASVVTDRALDWLKQNAQRKFFLWAHYYDPHQPYDPPEPYKHEYAKNLYDGEIAYMDEQVGRLLDGLDQLALTSHTLVIAVGDHGESLGEHGELTHGIFLYDATLHVPLIVAGPDVPRGKVIDDQVRSIDLHPTAMEFLHLPASAEAQGISLWPLIEQGTHVRSNYSYGETLYPRTYMGWSELRAMRTDAWKLILAPHPELYDLERDPGELQNLIAHHPAEADQLQKKIWEVAGTQAKTEKVATVPVDEQTRQELESLGYVSGGSAREIQLGGDAPDPKDRIAIMKTMEEGEKFLNAHDNARAAQVMEQALRQDPGNPMVHIYLAMALERAGQLPRAVAVYEDAIHRHVFTDIIYSRLGKLYLRLHELDKAVDVMSRANQINPTDLDNLRNLGTAQLQLGRVDEAEKAFKAINLQNDHYSAAYNGLGLVAIQRGDGDAAQRDFERAIALDSTEVEPLLNLGVLFDKAGNKPQALRYYQQFLEKASPKDYSALIPKVRAAVQDLKSGG